MTHFTLFLRAATGWQLKADTTAGFDGRGGRLGRGSRGGHLSLCLRPCDLCLDQVFLPHLIGCLSLVSLPRVRRSAKGFRRTVDPGDEQAIVLLLYTAEPFAAEKLDEVGERMSTRCVKMSVMLVGDVGLVKAVRMHALLVRN